MTNIEKLHKNQTLLRLKTKQDQKNPWLNNLSDRLSELTSLEYGWDCYDGVPVTKNVRVHAERLLCKLYQPEIIEPVAYPASDGSLILDWSVDGYRLELTIHTTGLLEIFWKNSYTKEKDCFEIPDTEVDLSKVNQLLSIFKVIQHNNRTKSDEEKLVAHS